VSSAAAAKESARRTRVSPSFFYIYAIDGWLFVMSRWKGAKRADSPAFSIAVVFKGGGTFDGRHYNHTAENFALLLPRNKKLSPALYTPRYNIYTYHTITTPSLVD
jgi:hypothetical protein